MRPSTTVFRKARIRALEGDIQFNEADQTTFMDAELEASFRSPMETAMAATILQKDAGRIQLIGRSGLARAGIESTIQEVTIGPNRESFRIAARISSLMRASDARILATIRHMFQEKGPGEIEIGRILVTKPEDQLSQEDVNKAKDQYHIMLPESAIVDENGVIEIPLEDLQYLFCLDNLTEETARRIITLGKHGLHGVQDIMPGLPETLGEKEFFVGGIRIAIGPYIAVIDRETNDSDVIHLAALVLDGLKTTGMNVYRQVELFNQKDSSVKLRDLKIRIRLYPHNGKLQSMSQKLLTDPETSKRIMSQGVRFSDVAELKTIEGLMGGISRRIDQVSSNALIIAPQRMTRVDWQATRAFQDRHTHQKAQELLETKSISTAVATSTSELSREKE